MTPTAASASSRRTTRRTRRLAAVGAVLVPSLVAGLALPAASGDSPPGAASATAADAAVLNEWNTLAQGIALTLRPTAHGQSRGIAMVQGAVYDAVNAIDRGHQPYLVDVEALDVSPAASYGAAIATAAHDVLLAIAPGSQVTVDTALSNTLAAIPDGPGEDLGVAAGQAAAAAMLADRADDGFLAPFDFAPHVGTGPGDWRPTALDPDPWVGYLEPFLMRAPSQFRSEGPDALTSASYADDFREVKRLGSLTSTARTADQTQAALFWQSPPAIFWNRMVRDLSAAHGLGAVDEARLLALVNLAAADGAIACWNDKYHWDFWRPVTAIRDAGIDGNPATVADPAWTPLFDGATATFPPLVNPPNPPFPDHPSGHGCVSGAALNTARAFFGTDKVELDLYSTRFPGQPRHFDRFSHALKEIIDARVWGGIHFRNADVQGAVIGKKVARLATRSYFLPS
ncbi:vanadium-dependent haloperoxidase [Nocardioides sp. HDW12B]|uniref:vanadium-dependent haloperoxidase n=1 Tax=Nocardioides sp. HDW12B TaxID=2714939 RepID=UPI0014097E72|nr:vanadium-dependent haloperoxidase [Nocardioides sp. HDW12B]QIK66732.1 vanadium-dependent haloperoxidase [Nocardioides sp. HDW12B]